MAEDNTLISRAQSGDEQAFAELMRAYYTFVYRIVIKIVNNPHDAEEVVQDIFLNAYRGLAQYEEQTKFGSWLAKIARNCALNWRREQRADTVSINDVGEDSLQYMDSPSEQLIRDEQLEMIRRAMNTLSQKDRDIARSYYLEGASYDELVRAHGLSYKAISFRLSRAKRTLSKRLQYLLNVAFVPPAMTLKKISSGGFTAMNVGTVPKIAVGVIAIVIIVFIGSHQLLSPKDGPSSSIKTTVSTASKPEQTTPEFDPSFGRVSAVPVHVDEPQITTEEMGQIEDFFAQLEAADTRSETETSQLATDVEAHQDSEEDYSPDPSAATESTEHSAEDVMGAYVEALKNLDSKAILTFMPAGEFRDLWNDFDSNPTTELREVLQWTFGQAEIVSSGHVGDEFHFRLKVWLPISQLLENVNLPEGALEGFLPPEILEFLETPKSVVLPHKMKKENGAWQIFEL
ncbi:MAG: sigma-70 family RNA polymerase sigma factor [Candidatus Poribacteria bacterium]|nr:sigma-70 family RNA polymerase sigma factor [Candidatus Poribacteria bacterium]